MMRGQLLLAALLLAVPAAAQVPPDLAARTRAAGQTMDPASAQGYAALFPPEAWQGVSIERDVAYGPDPLHKLDIYTTRGDSGPRPVLLFVHGGGYVRGDKHGAFYPDNIPMWAAKHGMVGVSINYRLAPDNPYPEAAEDLYSAISWLDGNIYRYGGDSLKIVLFGHSAGANHVADFLGERSFFWLDGPGIIGAVLLSPAYPAYPGTYPHPYYGAGPEVNSPAGAVNRLRGNRIPVFLADAEFDPDLMQDTSTALREGLCAVPESCPTYVHLQDHNHFTEGMSLGTDDQSLARPLLEWIARLTGERG
jgi:triacylglycerol lipase